MTILPNGNLLVPMRAEGEGVIGDGLVEISPGHPDYERWLEYLQRQSAWAKDHPAPQKPRKTKGKRRA